MKHIYRYILVTIMALGLSGCTTVESFNAHKKVEIERGLISDSYKQDGKNINASELQTYLVKNEKANVKLKKAHYLALGGIGVFLAGHYFLIRSVNGDIQQRQQEFLLALGALVTGTVFLAYSSSYFSDAVEIYNEGITSPEQSKQAAWFPILEVTSDPFIPQTEAPAPAIGLGFHF